MSKHKYLLDSNIIIILWGKHPKVLQEMDINKNIDYAIIKEIAIELSQKEYTFYNETAVLSQRFLNLLKHVDETEISPDLSYFSESSDIKSVYSGMVYYVKDNKLSRNDFLLLCFCGKNKEYILVTEDKKLLSSGRYLLGDSRVYNFKEFLSQTYS